MDSLFFFFLNIWSTLAMKFSSKHYMLGHPEGRLDGCGHNNSWWNGWAPAAYQMFEWDSVHCIGHPRIDRDTSLQISAATLRDLAEVARQGGTPLLVTSSGGRYSGNQPVDVVVDEINARIEALRAGVTIIDVTYYTPLNFAEHGLSEENTRHIGVHWGAASGIYALGPRLGREACRQLKAQRSLNVAKIWSSATWKLRPDTVLEHFRAACPQVELHIVWEFQCKAEICDDLPPGFFVSHPVPDLILAQDDEGFDGALKAAGEVLPQARVAQILGVGYEREEPGVKLLVERKLIATTDMMMKYPKAGYWAKIEQLIKIIEANETANTTAGFRGALRIPENHDVAISTEDELLVISRDPQGAIMDRLMPAYERRTPPATSLQVATGLQRVTILGVDITEGKFEAVASLIIQWVDGRLAWSVYEFDGVMQLDASDVWVPNVQFANEYDSKAIFQGPIIIRNDGLVTMSVHRRVQMLCDMDVTLFPFDSHMCHFMLTSPTPVNQMQLDASLGLSFDDTDHNFETEHSVSTGVDDTGRSFVSYTLSMKRKPLGMWLKLILPAILLNLVGFMSFWVSEQGDALNLGITTLLCTLAIRDSVELPESSKLIWAELFMMINLTFQAVVLFLTFVGYSNRLNQFANRVVYDIFGNRVATTGARPKERGENGEESSGTQAMRGSAGDAPESSKACQDVATVSVPGASIAAPHVEGNGSSQAAESERDNSSKPRKRGIASIVADTFVATGDEVRAGSVLGQLIVIPTFVVVMAWVLADPHFWLADA